MRSAKPIVVTKEKKRRCVAPVAQGKHIKAN